MSDSNPPRGAADRRRGSVAAPSPLTLGTWLERLANPLAHMSAEDAEAYVNDLTFGGGAYAYVSRDGTVRRLDPNNIRAEPKDD